MDELARCNIWISFAGDEQRATKVSVVVESLVRQASEYRLLFDDQDIAKVVWKSDILHVLCRWDETSLSSTVRMCFVL